MKPYSEWTNDELWRQERMNFSVHMADIFTYLQKHNLSVDDFVRYTAPQVMNGWKDEVKTPAEMMNAVLVNVRANGGEVLDTSFEGDACSSATVTCLLDEKLMSNFGCHDEVTCKLWDKFIPIAAALGMRFEWERLGEKRYHIQVRR